MKKTSEDQKEQKKQQFVDALEKLKAVVDKGQHVAIENLLTAGDEFSQSLVLFDIMVDTDTIKSLLVQDELRVKTLCDFYGVKLSDIARESLLNNLAQSRQSRRANVLLRSGVQRERDAFVFELAKRCALSQQRYNQK